MDAQTRREKQQQEVDANYEVFKARLDELLGERPGQFALMKDRKVVEFFDTREDAVKAGKMLFDDGIFSAHEISDEVVDLGVYSWA